MTRRLLAPPSLVKPRPGIVGAADCSPEYQPFWDNLLLYFPLYQEDQAFDIISGNALTAQGAPVQVTTDIGAAMQFNGANWYDGDPGAYADVTDTITLAMLFRYNATGSDDYGRLTGLHDGTSAHAAMLHAEDTNLRMLVDTSGGVDFITASAGMIAGEWILYVGRWRSGLTLDVYAIDMLGVIRDSGIEGSPVSGTIDPSTNFVVAGVNATTALAGEVASVWEWNDIKSITQLQQLAINPFGMITSVRRNRRVVAAPPAEGVISPYYSDHYYRNIVQEIAA